MAAELRYNGEWLIPLQQGYRVSSGYSAQLSGGYPASGLRRQAVTVSASYRLKDAAMIAWWWALYETNRGQPLIAILDTAGYPAEHTIRITDPPQFSEYAGHTAVVSVVMACSHSVPDADAQSWVDWWAGGGGDGGGSAAEYRGFLLARYNFVGATQSTIPNTMPGPDAVFVGEISPQPTFVNDGILSTMRQQAGAASWQTDGFFDTQIERQATATMAFSIWLALDITPYPDTLASGLNYRQIDASILRTPTGGGGNDTNGVAIANSANGYFAQFDVKAGGDFDRALYSDRQLGAKSGLINVIVTYAGNQGATETITIYINGQHSSTWPGTGPLTSESLKIFAEFRNFTSGNVVPYSGDFVFADVRLYEGVPAGDFADLASRIYADGPR